MTDIVVFCSIQVIERNTENIAYKNMLYIRSASLFRPPPEGSQYWEKSSSKNFELDFNSQKHKITKPPEYIDKTQQVYYLERWCRL